MPLHQHPHFDLLRPLGGGGSSSVWLGKDKVTGMLVAIKIFPPRADGAALWQCREEYRKTSAQKHPNIIQVLDHGEWRDEAFLVMPYFPQGSVQEHIGQLSESECWQLVHDIGLALEHLHEHNKPVVLHNDLKPDNFLRSDTGRYVLTDLGISLELKPEYLQNTSGQALWASAAGQGPDAYRAPQLFDYQGEPRSIPTKKSEIWSLGACLFEIATGKTPFGEQGGRYQHLARVQGLRVRDLRRDLPAHYSEEIKTLIVDCLHYDLYERPSISDIVETAKAALVRYGKNKPESYITESNSAGIVYPDSIYVPTVEKAYVQSSRIRTKWLSMKNTIMLALLFLMIAVVYFTFSGGGIGWFNNDKITTQSPDLKNNNQGKDIEKSSIAPDEVKRDMSETMNKVLQSDPNPTEKALKSGGISNEPGFYLVQYLRDLRQVINSLSSQESECKEALDVLYAQMEKCTDINNSKCAKASLCQADPNCGKIAILQKKYGCNVSSQGNVEFQGTAEEDAEAKVLALAEMLNKKKKIPPYKPGETQFYGVSIGATKTLASAKWQRGQERIINKIKGIILVYNPNSEWKYLLVVEARNEKDVDELLNEHKSRGASKVTYRKITQGQNSWYQMVSPW